MSLEPRAFILFAANTGLVLLVQLVNSALAGWSLHLFLLGPTLVLAPLYLRPSAAFTCAVLTGLWVDAALPVPFGCFTLAFPILGTSLSLVRLRFRPGDNAQPALLAQTANLILFVVVSLATSASLLSQPAHWLRLATDLVFSQAALLLLAPWFFNLQRCLFHLLRVEYEPDNLPLP